MKHLTNLPNILLIGWVKFVLFGDKIEETLSLFSICLFVNFRIYFDQQADHAL